MILTFTKRASAERGLSEISWLKSYHSFSFGDYHDFKHMGFGALRVINDDVIAPGAGFGMHGHRDMEIVTIVLSGALAHKDNIGNGTSILPYDVQRMSAGTGIEHSEFNASQTDATRLLQIWVLPEVRGIKPSYEQKKIDVNDVQNKLCLIAARKDGAITIHQDLDLYRTQIDSGKNVPFNIRANRRVWIQVASGEAIVHGHALSEGDALAVVSDADEKAEAVVINLQSKTACDLLIFDQPV
ncbi:MAG: pirin family protein [Alphaproteobacteria bacterium]|nr:pirin family protein [Alphaproteobacteria bacterium]